MKIVEPEEPGLDTIMAKTDEIALADYYYHIYFVRAT
jgi:hypothetical protein